MKLLSTIFKSNLFKITSLNSLSVVLKIGIGLVTSKLIAIFVGPNGMALVGNFRNFITLNDTISSLGFQTGVVKEVAENKDDSNEFKRIFSTVFFSLLFIAFLLSFFFFFGSGYLNRIIFDANYNFEIVFKVLALVLPFYSLSMFFISIINGLGGYKKVIYVNIIGNIIGLLVSIYMLQHFKTLGALLSIVISPSLLLFATLYYLNKEIKLSESLSLYYFTPKILKRLIPYSLMAIVSAIIIPLVYLIIRKIIIAKVGIDNAGYWEAMTRISSYYLLFISSIVSLYYLPKLAMAKSKTETRSVFFNFYKYIFPIFIIGTIIVFLMKSILIKLIFTHSFLPTTDLFFWQLLGDIFKVFSMILGFNLIAQKRTFAFIISELFSVTVMCFSSIYLINVVGFQGVVMAHATTYFFYSLYLVLYFRKTLF